MATKLKPCPACGSRIAKGARTCPHCGKSFTNAAGLLLAVLVALLIGGLLFGAHWMNARQASKEIDAIEKELRSAPR